MKPTSQSCTHTWSAHPASHLVNLLAGIRQQSPAWRKTAWLPIMPADLEYVQATIPTPHGKLATSWRKTDDGVNYQIEIPDGMTVRAQLQKRTEQMLTAGKYQYMIPMNQEVTV